MNEREFYPKIDRRIGINILHTDTSSLERSLLPDYNISQKRGKVDFIERTTTNGD